jgi:hypothetical protein
MTRFWRHDHEKELENALRSSRPEPRSDFVDDVAGRIESTRNRRARRPAGSLRLAFAVTAATALAASAGTVAGLAHSNRPAGGGPSAAIEMSHHDGQGDNPFDHQYQGKIPVCHNGMTLFLPPPAVLAHLFHGDTLGPCEEPVKIPICHRGHTIEVPIGPAILAHLRHGDSIGPCSGGRHHDDDED